MDGGVWWAAVHEVSKSRTRLSDFTFTFMHWGRKWQPTPVFLPGEPQGRGSLVGCRLWGRTESDMTEATQQQQQQRCDTWIQACSAAVRPHIGQHQTQRFLYQLPYHCCSVTHSCPALCNPMDDSTPGFPILHHLLELAQTYIHWISEAVQPSHPLSSPSPPAFNLFQHQGLF